jgi:DNA topoisomerase IB
VTDVDTLTRIRSLTIPPAWTDVWICPWPHGHIQALGTDAAGRRQYRYHDHWRIHRDRQKFERVADFATVLPKLRARVARDLAEPGLGRDRVVAAIVRLLDIAFFRVGGDEYAEANETFGAASLHREHVHVHGGVLRFKYPAKGSIDRTIEVRDKQVLEVIVELRRRRTASPQLFAYRQGTRWVDVHAPDVNDYIKSVAGDGFSAKDFRTWSATVLTAAVLAEAVSGAAGDAAASSHLQRHRTVVQAIARVAEYLGNTPAVCRSAYIDPRVLDRFENGEAIVLRELPEGLKRPGRYGTIGERRRRAVERAVVELMCEDGR